VFVVGGAAVAMAYDTARVTRDVDAAFKPHGIVLEEARQVADDLGLPYWWLNDTAAVDRDLGCREVTEAFAQAKSHADLTLW
jgi:hypothetical protein